MNSDEIKNWAQILTETHRTPLRKLELPGTKFLIPTGEENETQLLQDSLNVLEDALKRDRVERRASRTLAVWLPEKDLAKVIKVRGDISNFGFFSKDGRFLHPEETLFLLESNRLELLWENVNVNIQQAYEILLKNVTLPKYIAYKKLAQQGFKLLPANQVERTRDGAPLPKKGRFDDTNSLDVNDRTKITSNDNSVLGKCAEVFNKLKENGPKQWKVGYEQCEQELPAYQIFLPGNSNRMPDFNLKICNDNKNIESDINMVTDNDIPTIMNCSSSEFSGFFYTTNVNLPNL